MEEKWCITLLQRQQTGLWRMSIQKISCATDYKGRYNRQRLQAKLDIANK